MTRLIAAGNAGRVAGGHRRRAARAADLRLDPRAHGRVAPSTRLILVA